LTRVWTANTYCLSGVAWPRDEKTCSIRTRRQTQTGLCVNAHVIAVAITWRVAGAAFNCFFLSLENLFIRITIFDVIRQFKIALHDVKNKNTEGLHSLCWLDLSRCGIHHDDVSRKVAKRCHACTHKSRFRSEIAMKISYSSWLA
jgi:hypothetical protein